jgi:hypothetical protein
MMLVLLLCLSLLGCVPRQSCDEEPSQNRNNEDYPIAPDKPVIYLYPETQQQVTVKLDFKGQLTCTYPVYREGWTLRHVAGAPYDQSFPSEDAPRVRCVLCGTDNRRVDHGCAACGCSLPHRLPQKERHNP